VILGEAKVRLSQIQNCLDASVSSLRMAPLSSIGNTLDSCNLLIKEQHELQIKVHATESELKMGGETLREVSQALDSLDTKIDLLDQISLRSDLSTSQREPIFHQLETYRSTRDTLRISFTKYLWEFELV